MLFGILILLYNLLMFSMNIYTRYYFLAFISFIGIIFSTLIIARNIH